MIKATSCGGVVIFRGKILLLYKNYKNRYDGWVLPKGTVEAGEEYKETALREVHEETGVKASAIKYVGKSQYTFNTAHDVVVKQVHWYLMMADSYYSKPQKEEYFEDSGYYKYHEAYHLLRFPNERQILEDAYQQYIELKKAGLWGNRKYFQRMLKKDTLQRNCNVSFLFLFIKLLSIKIKKAVHYLSETTPQNYIYLIKKCR